MAEATITTEEIKLTDQSAKAKIVSVSGQLDESNIDTKAKEFYALLEGVNKIFLIFDFAGLDYMNSKSIGYMTDIYGKVTEKGGKMYIARTKPNIKDILEVVGLAQLIKIFDSIDEAKQTLAADAGSSVAVASATASAGAPTAPTAPTAPAAPVTTEPSQTQGTYTLKQ